MKKLIADVLSFLRILAAYWVLYFSLNKQWDVAFTLLVIGWGTDLLDGLAYRRWGSFSSEHGLDADGTADTIIAFGASLVPVVYGVTHNTTLGLALTIIYAATLLSGVLMMMALKRADRDPLARKVIAFNMLVFHGAFQIVATLSWFAYMAGGWWLSGLTLFVLGAVCFTQKHKLGWWWQGRLTADS